MSFWWTEKTLFANIYPYLRQNLPVQLHIQEILDNITTKNREQENLHSIFYVQLIAVACLSYHHANMLMFLSLLSDTVLSLRQTTNCTYRLVKNWITGDWVSKSAMCLIKLCNSFDLCLKMDAWTRCQNLLPDSILSVDWHFPLSNYVSNVKSLCSLTTKILHPIQNVQIGKVWSH